ncbi:hypothetical protein OCOJLMKI_0050 [Methylobacterium iners]|uniref:Tc1-like transposase DDE domain-containing protein n=1 Tax=Methylobacterium iners TaxID=418707 RepID=A0ABQ4RSB5_9HYPH|nr:hypothetical protein OCOJLMKI_0050 [Methylobacterium iners]
MGVRQASFDRVLVLELIAGDIVVMDNLGSHKCPAVRVAIEATSSRLTAPTSILTFCGGDAG